MATTPAGVFIMSKTSSANAPLDSRVPVEHVLQMKLKLLTQRTKNLSGNFACFPPLIATLRTDELSALSQQTLTGLVDLASAVIDYMSACEDDTTNRLQRCEKPQALMYCEYSLCLLKILKQGDASVLGGLQKSFNSMVALLKQDMVAIETAAASINSSTRLQAAAQRIMQQQQQLKKIPNVCRKCWRQRLNAIESAASERLVTGAKTFRPSVLLCARCKQCFLLPVKRWRPRDHCPLRSSIARCTP
jgi:hypothetical protein